MSELPWHQIDTVLLDMDGTLLDLHFDNHFWLEHLPNRYAQLNGISRAAADEKLLPLFHQHAGKLTWYCLDFWSQTLELSITELKREVAERIAPRADTQAFLSSLRQAGKRTALVTNAHRDSLNLKLEKVDLEPWLDRLISSHDYGFPKEEQDFWQALQADFGFDPARTLFIDDSPAILRSAQRFGIQWLLAIKQPDSRQQPKPASEFEALENYQNLIEGLQRCS